MSAEALALGVAGAAILFLLTVIVGVLGWMVRGAFSDIKELRGRVEQAATRAELAAVQAAIAPLQTTLTRVETKLDILTKGAGPSR